MNPTGPTNDPSHGEEAASSAISEVDGEDTGEDTHNHGESNVSTAVTTSSNNGAESSSNANFSGAYSQAESAKISQQQTEKAGLAGLIQFINEALIELKKITWPDRQQVIKETLSVIVLVAIITACVLAFDFGIAKAVFEPLDKLARHLGGGIGVHH